MAKQAFVIDADVKRRAAITFFLNNQGWICEPFETIAEFVERWPSEGVVLLPDDRDSIAALLQEANARHAWLPVVAYAGSPELGQIVDAVLEGAVGYVIWPGSGDALLKTLVACNERTNLRFFGQGRANRAQMIIKVLSPREAQILSGMAEGMSNRAIAQQMGISHRTVELHRANLLDKLGVRSSAEAIRLAIEASLPGTSEGGWPQRPEEAWGEMA